MQDLEPVVYVWQSDPSRIAGGWDLDPDRRNHPYVPIQAVAKARAEIERLEKEVENLRINSVKLLDAVDREYNSRTNAIIERHAAEMSELINQRDTAWNDAIEAAKKAVSSLTTPTSEEVMEGHERAYRAIESLELCKL